MDKPRRKDREFIYLISSLLLIFLGYYWYVFSSLQLEKSVSSSLYIIPIILLIAIILTTFIYLVYYSDKQQTRLNKSTQFAAVFFIFNIFTYFILTNIFFYDRGNKVTVIIIQPIFNVLTVTSYIITLLLLKKQVINYSEKDHIIYTRIKEILKKRNTKFNSLLLWAGLFAFSNIGIVQSITIGVFYIYPFFYVLMALLSIINIVNIVYNINNKEQLIYKNNKYLLYIWIIGFTLSFILTITFLLLFIFIEKFIFAYILIGTPFIYFLSSLYGEQKLLKYQLYLYDVKQPSDISNPESNNII